MSHSFFFILSFKLYMYLKNHITLSFLVLFRSRVGNFTSVHCNFPQWGYKIDCNFILICKVVVRVNFFPNNTLFNLQPSEPPVDISDCHLHSADENLGLTQIEGATRGHATPAGLRLRLELVLPSYVRSFQWQRRFSKKSWESIKSAMRVVLWMLLFTYAVIHTFAFDQQ